MSTAILTNTVNRCMAEGAPAYVEKPANFLCALPFSGFYYSLHADEVDQCLESMLTDRETGCEPAPDFIRDAAWQAVDYSAVYWRYAKAYAESFLDWLELKGRFESMESPRYYNFETDRIFVELTRDEVAKLWRKTDRETFADCCKERFTHRSGFISSYSPDWRDWGHLSTWDHNQIGTILAAYALQQYRDETCATDWDQWAEFSVVEDLRGNGCIDNWIFEESGPKLARAINAWSYLQERAKRQQD